MQNNIQKELSNLLWFFKRKTQHIVFCNKPVAFGKNRVIVNCIKKN